MQRIPLQCARMHFQQQNRLTTPVPALARNLLRPARLRRLFAVDSFHQQHLWWPLVAFTIASLLLMGLGLDQWLADRIYVLGGHAWALQSSHVTEVLIHEGGRQLSQFVWVGVALCLLLALVHKSGSQWRRPLTYLLLSTLLATALVGIMKRATHMDCPWDLLRYGGEKAYYGLFTRRPPGLGGAGCFPAGHASAGYAWVALYFFLLATRPRWRWWGLGLPLASGLVFGIAQQLRGAHFLSHDVWSLMLCWLVALSLYRLMLVPRMRAVPAETRA